MKIRAHTPLCWITATGGDPVAATPLDMFALGEHLGACRHKHRHLFALHCVAESLHGFAATRFVTTLLAISLLMGAAYWLF